MTSGNALFVTATGTGRGFQELADIQGRMRADRRECLRGGGQTLLLRRLITMRD